MTASSSALQMSFVSSMTSESSSIFGISSSSQNVVGTPSESPHLFGTSSLLVASETVVDDADDSDASSTVFYVRNNGTTDGGGKPNGQQQQQKQKKQNVNNSNGGGVVVHVRHLPKQKAKFPCTKCNTKFKSIEMLELHENNCSRSALSSFCDICNRKFVSPRGVSTHKWKAHSEKGNKLPKTEQQRLQNNVCCDKHHDGTHNQCGTSITAKRGRPRSVPSASVGKHNAVRSIDRCQKNNAITTTAAAAKQTNGANVQITNMRKRGYSLKPNGGPSLEDNNGTKNRQNANGGEGKGQRRARSVINGANQQNGGTQQMNNVNADGDEEEDDIIVLDHDVKHRIVPRNNFGNVVQQPNSAAPVVGPISHYAGMVISACAQSNLVTFHDVNTARGTIGQISFQFMCNKCRGQRGVARCFRGRAYCIMCCGHPECD